MSAKTPSRKPTPRGKSRAATQQKPGKNTAPAAAKTRRLPAPAAASAAKTRSPTKSAAATDPSTKQSRLITLLSTPAGGTLTQMMALTGWQAHSVRGVISGVLRKKLGLKVDCDTPGAAGARIYRITAANVAA
ncbi:MAG: DUF3489 domain-containing protein [Casimicrobiaceae bacterium]